MNIAVLTMVAGAGAVAVGRLSAPSREAYCRRHGYDLSTLTDALDPSRAPVWSKLLYLRQQLGEYDWLFWHDCDSLITNPDLPLGPLCREAAAAGADVVITRDRHGCNTGQFLLAGRSSRAGPFLDACYAQDRFAAPGRVLRDQAAVTHVIDAKIAPINVLYGPKCRLNADVYDWREGDFLCHFYGQPARVWLMRQWLRDRLGRPGDVPPPLSGLPPVPASTPPQDPGTIRAALSAARDDLSAGRAADAEATCRAVLSAAPADARAWHVLGLALDARGRHDEAMDAVCRSLDLAPAVADFHNNAGSLLGKYGHPAEAAACFRAALRRRPDFPAAARNLVDAEARAAAAAAIAAGGE